MQPLIDAWNYLVYIFTRYPGDKLRGFNNAGTL